MSPFPSTELGNTVPASHAVHTSSRYVHETPLTSQSTPQVAIDTGTTLIGVPSAVAQAIYAQIPNSQAMTAASGYAGYYQYPCSQNVNVTLQFGGLSYSINNADFNLGAFSSQNTNLCTGAFFEMNL
jgi:hypothetical protein